MNYTTDPWVYDRIPVKPGWYAIWQCWDTWENAGDPVEGPVPDAAYWNGNKWTKNHPNALIGRSPDPFENEKIAMDWADAHCPDG